MITIFEKFENIPDVNSLSPEFWKMTRVANWNSAIKSYTEYIDSPQIWEQVTEQVKKRLYLKYEFEDIQKFYQEYDPFYEELKMYFKELWLDRIDVSDDSYSDLISSVIGKGKLFAKMCIDDPEILVDMGNNDLYMENFGYLLNIDKKDYYDFRTKYDPLWGDIKKYNL